MKIIEIKLPCGKVLKVKLTHDVNLIEDENKVFMLIEGEKINDERHLHE